MQLLQLHHKPRVHLSAKWKAQYKLLPSTFHCETQLQSFRRQHEIETHLVQRPKKNHPKINISDNVVLLIVLQFEYWFCPGRLFQDLF